jgi:orotidine-5'-phosphate decarboxylase
MMRNALKTLLVLSVTSFPQVANAQSVAAGQNQYELKSRRLAESLTASCGSDFLVANLERSAFFRLKDIKDYKFNFSLNLYLLKI